ncbi:hypothetical protein [Arcticibacter sp. MXS-1]|uniref:hypothetical protein n=1 Tax=Arcticibacter sp. MXS-1 TaxID=3341726 RepID=UPI0035A8F733
MCQTRVLCSRESIVVSQCLHCQVLFIWHHNLFLSFSPKKFTAFCDAVNQLDYDQCAFPFPDGEERAIIASPNPEISFTFTYDEWRSFCEVLSEASYMREVYALMV